MWKRSVNEGGDLSLWAGSLVNKYVHELFSFSELLSLMLVACSTFVFALLNTSPGEQTVEVDFADVFFDQANVAQPASMNISS
jgi:alpha-galactosidase